MTAAIACGVCGADALLDLPAYSKLPRVTSDCKPWPAGGALAVCTRCGTIQKKPDAAWLDEIDRIYGAYEIYHLSDGGEQVIFSASGSSRSRSKALVDFVVARLGKSGPGSLIDIGCGNGSALANFSAALPGWTLDGTELSDRDLPVLRNIPGFRSLHTAPVQGEYDVVAMIHSLEHMVSPLDSVSDAAALVEPDGLLFVEVPDAETSPFDILVADHRTHFTRATLDALAGRASLAVDFLDNTVFPRRTRCSRTGATANRRASPTLGAAFGSRRTRSPGSTPFSALRPRPRRRISEFSEPPSPACGSTARCVSPSRSSSTKTCRGSAAATRAGPSFHPEEAPAESVVFVPMAKVIADRVAARLAGGAATYLTPPPMGRSTAG